ELQARHERAEGMGNARGLSAGNLFSLTGHPREDHNREYLVLAVSHEIQSDDFETDSGSGRGGAQLYSATLEAMDAKVPFRSARVTPKPIVQGPQSAVVVGPEGEEIHTDEFGRIRVRFPW